MVAKQSPDGALKRLGDSLVAWIESRQEARGKKKSLRDYLREAAEAHFDPREMMIDYLAALLWARAGRDGMPPSAAIDAVLAAQKTKIIPIKDITLLPLVLEGQVPDDWPAVIEVAAPAPPPAPATTDEPAPSPPGENPAPSSGMGEGEGRALVQSLKAQKRQKQIEKIRARQATIGATDAVAICGINPWKGPLEVWLDKTRDPEEIYAWQERNPNRHRMEDGQRLEPVVAQWWAEEHPEWDVTGDGERSYTHLTIPWASASPDRVVLWDRYQRLLEIKTHEGWPWPQVPHYYIAQLDWQFLVMNSHFRDLQATAHLAARFSGGNYREYQITIDPSRVDLMLAEVTRWYEKHIIGKVAPSVKGSADPDGSIARVHDEGNLDHLQLGMLGDKAALAEKLATDLVKWQDREKLAETVKNKIRGQLGEIIGNHRGMFTSTHKITWFNVSGKTRIDWEEIARKRGATEQDVQLATSRGVTTRQWRITELKGGNDGNE